MSDEVCLNQAFSEDDELFDIYMQDGKTIIGSLREIYDKGKADALNIDLDTPMHFTPEQKAWVKKYISINGERQRIDGAREFAEVIKSRSSEMVQAFIDRQLAEWQKGVKNE